MTGDKLRDILNTRPFAPFILHLADGRNITVPHPEFMSLSPSGRVAHLFESDESSQFIDVMLITSVELRSPPPDNGDARNSRGRST